MSYWDYEDGNDIITADVSSDLSILSEWLYDFSLPSHVK